MPEHNIWSAHHSLRKDSLPPPWIIEQLTGKESHLYISCPLEQTLTQELSLSYTAVQSPLMLSRCSYVAHWYVQRRKDQDCTAIKQPVPNQQLLLHTAVSTCSLLLLLLVSLLLLALLLLLSLLPFVTSVLRGTDTPDVFSLLTK